MARTERKIKFLDFQTCVQCALDSLVLQRQVLQSSLSMENDIIPLFREGKGLVAMRIDPKWFKTEWWINMEIISNDIKVLMVRTRSQITPRVADEKNGTHYRSAFDDRIHLQAKMGLGLI